MVNEPVSCPELDALGRCGGPVGAGRRQRASTPVLFGGRRARSAAICCGPRPSWSRSARHRVAVTSASGLSRHAQRPVKAPPAHSCSRPVVPAGLRFQRRVRPRSPGRGLAVASSAGSSTRARAYVSKDAGLGASVSSRARTVQPIGARAHPGGRPPLRGVGPDPRLDATESVQVGHSQFVGFLSKGLTRAQVEQVASSDDHASRPGQPVVERRRAGRAAPCRRHVDHDDRPGGCPRRSATTEPGRTPWCGWAGRASWWSRCVLLRREGWPPRGSSSTGRRRCGWMGTGAGSGATRGWGSSWRDSTRSCSTRARARSRSSPPARARPSSCASPRPSGPSTRLGSFDGSPGTVGRSGPWGPGRRSSPRAATPALADLGRPAAGFRWAEAADRRPALPAR